MGGLGTDRLFGGPGNDWVIAEPADVQPLNDGDNDTIPNVDDGFGPTWSTVLLPLPPATTPSAKLLGGGDGRDHLVGGRGPATMYGDRYHTDQECVLGTNPDPRHPASPSSQVSLRTGPDPRRSRHGRRARRWCERLGDHVR